jgi:hypothetical protein
VPGAEAAFHITLSTSLVQHLAQASWGAHGVGLATLGTALHSQLAVSTMTQELEQAGGVVIGAGALVVPASSTLVLGKRPPTQAIGDGHALIRCVENALGLLGTLYPQSADPHAHTAWRFLHDVAIYLRFLVNEYGAGSSQWATGLAAILDESLGKHFGALKRAAALVDLADHDGVADALLAAYENEFAPIFDRPLKPSEARQAMGAPSSASSPTAAEAVHKVIQAALNDATVCARFLTGSCNGKRTCPYSHAELTPAQYGQVLRALVSHFRKHPTTAATESA